MGIRFTKQKPNKTRALDHDSQQLSYISYDETRNSPTLNFTTDSDNVCMEGSILLNSKEDNVSVTIKTGDNNDEDVVRVSLISMPRTESPSFDNNIMHNSNGTEKDVKGSPTIQKFQTLPSRSMKKRIIKHRHSVTLGDGYFRHSKISSRNKEMTVQSNEDIYSTERLKQVENWPHHSNDSIFMPKYPLDHKKLGQYQVCGKIGSGAFSQVFMVIEKESSTCYALKKLQKSSIITKKMIQQVQDEMKILVRISRHQFILGLITCWQTKGYLCQVLPYVPGGDLYKLWKKEKVFSIQCVSHTAAEIAVALDFLYTKKILYRDLKMENILISRTGHILLSDFGFSKCMNVGTRAYTICGTLRYMAPEIATGTGYSYESDWWSLGVVVVAMATGKFPFKLVNDHKDMLKEIKANILNLPKMSDDLAIKDAIRKFLNYRPWHRFSSLCEAQEMKLFRDINFDEILQLTIIRIKSRHPVSMCRYCLESYSQRYKEKTFSTLWLRIRYPIF